jgi:hypothetical protein
MTPRIDTVVFFVEGERHDFFCKDVTNLAASTEHEYFYAQKPLLAASEVATQDQLISDPDPAATDAAIVKLVTSIQTCQSVTIKLFGNTVTALGKDLSYQVRPEALVELKAFCTSLLTTK